eukprot:1194734-Prorocentrum_minimum.AAC.3
MRAGIYRESEPIKLGTRGPRGPFRVRRDFSSRPHHLQAVANRATRAGIYPGYPSHTPGTRTFIMGISLLSSTSVGALLSSLPVSKRYSALSSSSAPAFS